MAERTEELRLALVMNGGVSLAVWMGGVTNEIFRLVNDRHPVYTKLLDLTGTAARVDVISGTSAGGVNGAALAVACIYGGDFARLRDVWLETGAFADLLRSPMEDNPGSLLQGDEFFLPNIEKAFRALVPAGASVADAGTRPVELELTTTLLTGRQGNNVDDLGTELHDVDYRARFRFAHRSVGEGGSDFDPQARIVAKLARAARSTASFPFAFEPSQLTEDNIGTHLCAADGTPLADLPRYVVDGGVLDNKPFASARKSIFAMRTRRSVRRVLAYINPDPGDGPPGVTGGPAPSLARVLVEGLLTIPMSQTISDQLAAIKDHNQSVRAKKDSVTSLASLGRALLERLASDLYRVYHRRRLSSTFDTFVLDPLSDAARAKPQYARGLRALGKSGRQQLKLAFIDGCGEGWLPPKWPDAHSPDEEALFACDTWGWGLYPVEFGAKVVLEMLRMTQKIVDDNGERHPAARPLDRHDDTRVHEPRDWSDPGWRHDPPPVAEPAPGSVDGQLAGFWNGANAAIDAMLKLRDEERVEHWNPKIEAFLEALSDRVDAADVVEPPSLEWCMGRYEEIFAFLATTARRQRCAKLAESLAAILVPLSALASAQVGLAVTRYDELRRGDIDLAKRLVDFATFFQSAGPTHRDVLRALMTLEVVEFSFTDHESLDNATNIELVEISGNGASPLGGRRDARDKLLGLQLAHFGAFYRRSWRANDWLYGRLDGAERLVRIALDPERLKRQCDGDATLAFAHVRSIAVASVDSPRLRDKLDALWRAERYDTLVANELAYIGNVEAPVPDALTHCARAITQRLHLGILAEEMPQLIDSISRDQADGASRRGGGDAILRSLRDPARGDTDALDFSPDQAILWLRNGLVADETLLGQAGSDLFTSTLAHTAATLQGTLASKQASLGPISALFAAVKLPVLGFYFASKGLLGQSRTNAALNGGILALGTLLVVLQFFWAPAQLQADSIPRTLTLLGWALLAYGAIVSMLRGPWTLLALGVIGLAVVSLQTSGSLPTTQVVGVAALLLLMALSTRLAWLQLVTGFVVIAVAALWGSGGLAPGADRSAIRFDVLLLAIVLMVALAVAVVQASSLPRRVAARFGWLPALVAPVPLRREVLGMKLIVLPSRLRPRRIAQVTIARIDADGPAARVDLRRDDEILAIGRDDVKGLGIDDFDRVATRPDHGERLVVRARGPGERPHDVELQRQ